MSRELLAAIAGAIVGAAIAGIIAWLLQWQSLRAAEKQRVHDAHERNRTLARSLIVRLTILHSHLAQMDNHMKAVFGTIANHPDPKPEPWQVARPVTPLPTPIVIPTDELTLLLGLKLDTLFNDAVMLDEKHNTVVALFEEYGRHKGELTAMMPPEGITDDVAHIALTQEQARLVRPMMVECNQLADAMREYAERNAKESWALLSRMTAAFNEKLQLKLEIEQVQDRPPARI
jgi:hypothetical protein